MDNSIGNSTATNQNCASLVKELLTVESPSLVRATPSQPGIWHDDKNLFPLNFCKQKVVSGNGEKVTFVFSTLHEEDVFNHYHNQKPGFKQPRGFAKHKGQRCLTSLGTIPKDLIPGWTKDVLPASVESAQMVCQTVNLHGGLERKTERDTHTERGEDNCSFSCSLRRLSVGEVSIITFDKDRHYHSCERKNLEFLPFTRQEHRFILKILMTYADPKEAVEKVFRAAQEQCEREGLLPTRLTTMTEAKLRKFARKARIQHEVLPGEQDLVASRETLLEFQRNGATVAYKLPGRSVDSPDSILDPDSKAFLDTKDLFIFVMSKFQARLLRKYGKCVATDATHSVFAYNNLKLIVLLVASFSTDPTEKFVKERGFPVAMVITNSEREGIHKAIVRHAIIGAGSDWVPRILMTDMAFSAYNAWRSFFPELIWLWCVFHVWQAWIRKLSRVARPEGMGVREFKLIKGKLIQEMKDLIAPKEELKAEDFKRRVMVVSDLMWGIGLYEHGESLDTYINNSSRWAPPSRRAAVLLVFGWVYELPMLAKSNNPLERFFGVLKHTILLTAIRTIAAFLSVWRLYLARVWVNAVNAKVTRVLEQGAGSDNLPEDSTEGNIRPETDAFGSDDDMTAGEDTDGSDTEMDDDVNNDAGEDGAPIGAENDADFETVMQQQQKEQWKASHTTVSELVPALIQALSEFQLKVSPMKYGNENVVTNDEMRATIASMKALKGQLASMSSPNRVEVVGLALSTAVEGFKKQREYQDDEPCFIPAMFAIPLCQKLGVQSVGRPRRSSLVSTDAATVEGNSLATSVMTEASSPYASRSTGTSFPDAYSSTETSYLDTSMSTEASSPETSMVSMSNEATSPVTSNGTSSVSTMASTGLSSSSSSSTTARMQSVQPQKALGPDEGAAYSKPGAHIAEPAIDLSILYKPKRKRDRKAPSEDWLKFEHVPFETFAQTFLTDDMRERIVKAKERAAQSGLPALRVALAWNTIKRIRAVAFHLFQWRFPDSLPKPRLISEFIEKLTVLNPRLPPDIATAIGDIGIVHTADGILGRGDIVLLKVNATSNAGESCVATCENLCGWVALDGSYVAVDHVPLRCIYWCRLVERI